MSRRQPPGPGGDVAEPNPFVSRSRSSAGSHLASNSAAEDGPVFDTADVHLTTTPGKRSTRAAAASAAAAATAEEPEPDVPAGSRSGSGSSSSALASQLTSRMLPPHPRVFTALAGSVRTCAELPLVPGQRRLWLNSRDDPTPVIDSADVITALAAAPAQDARAAAGGSNHGDGGDDEEDADDAAASAAATATVARMLTKACDVPREISQLTSPLPPSAAVPGRGLVGLANLGNTCYLNSVLQALLHLPPLLSLLLRTVVPRGSALDAPTEARTSATGELCALAQDIWSECRGGALRPLRFLSAFGRANGFFQGYEQHDAHELLRALIDTLQEGTGVECEYSHWQHDAGSDASRRAAAAAEAARARDEAERRRAIVEAERAGKEPPKPTPPPPPPRFPKFCGVSDVFEGELTSEVMCSRCGNVSVTQERFFDLSLELPGDKQLKKVSKERGSDAIVPPSHQGWFSRITQAVGLSSAPLSLETCLHSFCTGDTLEQRDRYHCDRCRERVEARKHMTVSRLPEVLCLHLKRFSHSNGVFGFSTSKVGAAVTYPLDDLDMTPYLHRTHPLAGPASPRAASGAPPHLSSAPPPPPSPVTPAVAPAWDGEISASPRYTLSAVVRHLGSASSGHYICYARHPLSQQWHCFDDKHVSAPLAPASVAREEAYLLLYTRRPQPGSVLSQSLATALTRAAAATVPRPISLAPGSHAQMYAALGAHWLQPADRSERAFVFAALRNGMLTPANAAAALAAAAAAGTSGSTAAGDANVRWLSRSWVVKALNWARVPPIDNRDLCCIHGVPLTVPPTTATATGHAPPPSLASVAAAVAALPQASPAAGVARTGAKARAPRRLEPAAPAWHSADYVTDFLSSAHAGAHPTPALADTLPFLPPLEPPAGAAEGGAAAARPGVSALEARAVPMTAAVWHELVARYGGGPEVRGYPVPPLPHAATAGAGTGKARAAAAAAAGGDGAFAYGVAQPQSLWLLHALTVSLSPASPVLSLKTSNIIPSAALLAATPVTTQTQTSPLPPPPTSPRTMPLPGGLPLLTVTGACARCVAARLAPAERDLISQLDAMPHDETEPYLLLPAAWLERWRRFVRDGGPRPGPIDNRALIDTASGRPRAGLRSGVDYRGLYAAVFFTLAQIYGAGPIILRATLDIYDERAVPEGFDAATGLPLPQPQQPQQKGRRGKAVDDEEEDEDEDEAEQHLRLNREIAAAVEDCAARGVPLA